MIDLYDDATNQLVGSITEADLQVLVDALEEESLQDRDYWVYPLHGESKRRTLTTPDELMAVLEHEFLITLPRSDALQGRVRGLFE
jgi:hypothetical protein